MPWITPVTYEKFATNLRFQMKVSLARGALAGGLGVAFGIYISVNASGGHINPAVSVAFLLLGKNKTSALRSFGWFFWYCFAQILGAFVASAIVYTTYLDAYTDAINDTFKSTDDFICLYATCPTNRYAHRQVNQILYPRKPQLTRKLKLFMMI